MRRLATFHHTASDLVTVLSRLLAVLCLVWVVGAVNSCDTPEEISDRYADAPQVFYVEVDVQGRWVSYTEKVASYAQLPNELSYFMKETLSKPDQPMAAPTTHCTQRFTPSAPNDNMHLVNVVEEHDGFNSILDFSGYWADGTFYVMTSYVGPDMNPKS